MWRPQTEERHSKSRLDTQRWPVPLQKLNHVISREIPRHQDLLFSLLISLRQRGSVLARVMTHRVHRALVVVLLFIALLSTFPVANLPPTHKDKVSLY